MTENEPVTGGSLLVVDDEATLVTALLSTLREQGYTVTGVTTPGDALEIIRRQPVDVMLTDLHLPEMDGIALLRAALEIDPAIMVILMTGFGTIDTAVGVCGEPGTLGDGGPASEARLKRPYGLELHESDSGLDLYISDTGNNTIRVVRLAP